MTSRGGAGARRVIRAADWREEIAPTVDQSRLEFANLVVRRLAQPGARIAVIDERGKPALVNCREALFDTLARDHAIVGVYAEGARVKDVVDDLKAAGL